VAGGAGAVAVRAARQSAAVRGIIIATVTALIAFWLIFSLLGLALEEGENVYCSCWADDRGSWGYVAQFLLALAGSGGLSAAAVDYLGRKRRAVVLVGGGAAAVALAGWVALLMSARP
jgi:hypothetical protein